MNKSLNYYDMALLSEAAYVDLKDIGGDTVTVYLIR